MIAGRADVCSESCSPAANANRTTSTPAPFERVWLWMPRAGTEGFGDEVPEERIGGVHRATIP